MMIGREEFPREVDDHRFVFAGREAQVLDDGPPMARGIANGERRPFNLHRFPLRDRRVDARVGRKEPTLGPLTNAGAVTLFLEGGLGPPMPRGIPHGERPPFYVLTFP